MDIRLLKIFSAIAREGALAAASRELHLTSSALSHGLKALESELGTRLFDRVGRRLVLNQAGEQLLVQIQEPLTALERAAAAVKDLGRWGQGRLRIGAPAGFCHHLLPDVIRDLHHEFPKLLIRLEVAENRRLLNQLEQNQIDLVISIQPEHAPGLEVTALFEDELLLAFSAEHRWATARNLSLEEIEREPFLLFDRSSATGHMLQEFLSQQGIKPTVRMETGSIEVLKRLVKLNVGIGVLPPWLFDQELTAASVVMRPLPGKGLKRRWAVLYRAHRRLTWPEEKLIQLLRARASSLRLTKRDLGPTSAPLDQDPALELHSVKG